MTWVLGPVPVNKVICLWYPAMQVKAPCEFIALRALTRPGTAAGWRVCASHSATSALGHGELHLLYRRRK